MEAAAQLKDLCQQRQVFINQAMVSAGEKRLIVAQGEMDIINSRCAGANEPTQCNGLIADVTKWLNDTKPLLQPDQQQKLQNYAAYTQAAVYINSEIADLVDKGITLDHSIDRNSNRGKDLLSALDTLTAAVDYYAKSPNPDPAIVAKMKDRQQSLQKTVTGLLFGK